MTDALDPSSIEYQVREQLASLEDALEKKLPNIAAILRPLHKNIKSDPDIVTLLTDDEIAVVCKGLSVTTANTLAVKIINSRSSSGKKSLKKTTVDDL